MSAVVRRFTLASWVSIMGRHCYLDFVKESDYATLERENAAMREVLNDIRTKAHCLAKAGPLHTPTLADAWRHFMAIDAMAGKALVQSRPTTAPDPDA